jgi:inorganic phosphate transporter, PiT family
VSVAVVVIVALALIFDYINGFHDAANAIATVVSTRVLTPRQAVAFAAFFDFIAFLVFGLSVATTIGKGIINPAAADLTVVAAALVGAIAWDLITWWFGIPSSSSHALIGGLAGAAVTKAGLGVLHVAGLVKVLASIVLSPLLGLVLAFILMTAVAWLFRRVTPARVDNVFRIGQLLSAALYSLGHGGNDAQKTMGLIAVLLFSAGLLEPGRGFYVPLWVVLACQAALALGVLTGGWRIVRTMGMKITKLKPVGGFCAETGGAMTLFVATFFGIPVSTTHTITGCIVGVGATSSLSAIRWGVAGRIVWAWLFTIPAAALISAAAYGLLRHIPALAGK